MDVDAWRSLERLGLAEWTGVKSAEGIDQDASEVLAPHALNADLRAGRVTAASLSTSSGCIAWGSTPAPRPSLAMIDYGERDLGPAMTAFENTLGGRVVVMGLLPMESIPQPAQDHADEERMRVAEPGTHACPGGDLRKGCRVAP